MADALVITALSRVEPLEPRSGHHARAVLPAAGQGEAPLAICDELNGRGIPTRCGGAWAPNQIRKACMAPEPVPEAVAA